MPLLGHHSGSEATNKSMDELELKLIALEKAVRTGESRVRSHQSIDHRPSVTALLGHPRPPAFAFAFVLRAADQMSRF